MATLTLIKYCFILTFPIIVHTQSCVSPTQSCDCFVKDGKTTINCRYKNLNTIPTFTPSNQVFDEIRFDSTEETGQCDSGSGCNNITLIPAHAFSNISVKVINLLNNPIATVNDFAFDDSNIIDNLEGLYLEGDGTIDPPYIAMSLLENLRMLHLDNYVSSIIQQPSVLPFPNLQSLTLKKWKNLQTLQQDRFSVMANLTSFSLQYLPSLVNLPVLTIQMFHNLKSIEIKNTGITTILGEVFSPLNSLSEVKIRQNINLGTIDSRAFYRVTDTVIFLDLDGNKLSSLAFLSTFNWTKLSHLNIGYNYELKTLPNGTFSTMPSMDYLQCQDIGLTNVNEAMFTNLNNLHTLDLSYNNIIDIGSAAFSHSTKLVELRLNSQSTEGKTVTFQNNAFSGIQSSLEILNLSEDKLNLDQLWIDISRLTNMRTLELNSVGITTIPNKTFADMTKLNSIYLQNNNITNLNQATFYGPKDTLQLIDLLNNNIVSIDSCVLSDFPTKPSFHLAENKLHCDCGLVWLYDLVQTDTDSETAYNIGMCTSPAALANKYFDEFTRTDMCPSGTSIPNCPDLYATTTTSTTTTTTTTTPSTTTTEIPLPNFSLIVNNEESTTIELTWVIEDKTYVTGLKIEMQSNYDSTKVTNLGVEETSHKFYQLRPDNYYTFCLILKINTDYRDSYPQCKAAKTRPQFTEPPVSTTVPPPESESQLGVIVGASVGGVVLIALIVAILIVLLKSNKPKKPKQLSEPISFTMRADVPHQGGTAKRFAKKPDKEGTSPDDINVTVISNGDMSNRDRISAGSYQTLNEKGIDTRPMPGTSHGHYTNSVEDRPLPKAPHGAPSWSGGATGHGYVNTDNKNGRLPESSKNEYSEVRY